MPQLSLIYIFSRVVSIKEHNASQAYSHFKQKMKNTNHTHIHEYHDHFVSSAVSLFLSIYFYRSYNPSAPGETKRVRLTKRCHFLLQDWQGYVLLALLSTLRYFLYNWHERRVSLPFNFAFLFSRPSIPPLIPISQWLWYSTSVWHETEQKSTRKLWV